MTTEQIERAVLLYYDDIMRYFVYRLRNRTAAEDLTQETFLRFIRYAEDARYEGERKCRSYLYTIASRVCLDFYSKNTDFAELDESVPAPTAENDTAMAIEAALTAPAVSLTVTISAAAVIWYYRTPGGDIVDNSGNPPPDDVSITSGENEQIISGDGYRIPRVTCFTVDGHTSLAVWSAPGYADLSGLRAVTDAGEEYPLTKTTFNLNSACVGYTNSDFPKPQSFALVCDSPAFRERVVLLTEDIIQVRSECGGITFFGSRAST